MLWLLSSYLMWNPLFAFTNLYVSHWLILDYRWLSMQVSKWLILVENFSWLNFYSKFSDLSPHLVAWQMLLIFSLPPAGTHHYNNYMPFALVIFGCNLYICISLMVCLKKYRCLDLIFQVSNSKCWRIKGF